MSVEKFHLHHGHGAGIGEERLSFLRTNSYFKKFVRAQYEIIIPSDNHGGQRLGYLSQALVNSFLSNSTKVRFPL